MKRTPRNPLRSASLLAFVLALALGAPVVLAQDARPDPEPPTSLAGGSTSPETGGTTANPDEGAAATQGDEPRPLNGTNDGVNSRRPVEPGMVKLAFKEEPLDERIFAFIAESTGKVVMPVNLLAIKNKKITLMTDEPIERAHALDMLFRAFRLHGIGVIEKPDVVIVGNLDEIIAFKLLPVIDASEDIMGRQDKGSLVVKIFAIKEVKASQIADLIGGDLPSHATLTADDNSNQIVVVGDIGLCQNLQQLIWELDHMYVEPKTQSFRLAHADATDISYSIEDLWPATVTGRSQGSRQPQRPTRPTPRGRTPQQPGTSVLGPEIELRVTVSAAQNSVTVIAAPEIVDEIARLIHEEWDLPRSSGTSKIYDLVYTDPLKVADKLNNLLGQGTGGGGRRPGGRPGAGGGQPIDVSQMLSGIYQIEAYPETNQLLVFCKTEESIEFLDDFIDKIDQPSSIGLPFVVELKHASAIELAEELNALLAEAGAQATIRLPDTGLTGEEIGSIGQEGGGGAAGGGAAGTMSFPWQRGGRQREDESPPTALIGKVRIVPIARQNALAVLCPRPQEEAVKQLINFFDRPGRQVMISAIIAEVELNDDLSLGWRLSNADDILGGANPDFRVGGTVGISGTEENPFSRLFDSSLLEANMSVSVVVQALQQRTSVRILQEPVIFTADNQEAYFFDGQDIPFITNTTINTQGNPTDSFEYKEVGVVLNVRPRITVERDVDLEVNLQLSSVVPGVTLFGGAIIDRRQTKTHIIVKNGQTIVLSGILKDEESKVTRGIPILSDIPLLGELFKSHEDSTTTTELIAFITPYVVDNPSENDTNFQQDFRDRLGDLSRPVDEQAKDRQEHPDKYREMILPEGGLRPRGGEASPEPQGEAGDQPAEGATSEPPVDIDELAGDA